MKTSHKCERTLVVVVVVVSGVEDFSEGCFVAGISEADALVPSDRTELTSSSRSS